MTKLKLKSIIKKNEFISMLQPMVDALSASVCIKDEGGEILFGKEENGQEFEFPVKADGEIIGLVQGNKNGLVIANLLNHFSQKETEKKKLGSEVLNLYQEINLIFNFSEKLAQSIDAPSICTITLNEARHVIASENAVMILWDKKEKKLRVHSSAGTDFFEEEKINSQVDFLLKIMLSGQSEIISDTASLMEAGIVLPEVQSVIYSSLKVNKRVMGAIILGTNETRQYTASDLKLLTTLALQSSAAIESALLYEKNIREAKEREDAMRLVYEVTGKFVPYEFIGALGHHVITDVRLGDQVEKIVTVLFSDIRDYTALSEQMSPGETFKFVCSFNERMGPAIRKHHGFINQYLGDAIMAIFPGNASDALSAAIEMMQEVEMLNKERSAQHQIPIRIGVGLHTGPLIMGITGDESRMDATTISDTVNIASRLESLTKHYKASILISEASLLQIEKEKYHLRNLGVVQLKGKQQATCIYECFSGNTTEEIIKKQKTLTIFNEAIAHYLNSSFSASAKAFESVTDLHPEDDTASFFLDNARKHFHAGVDEIRSGVMEMSVK